MFKENVVPTDFRTAGNCFGKVTKIPYAMLTSPSKEYIENLCPSQVNLPLTIHCNYRCFEKLLGYVEFEVLADSSMQEVLETSKHVGVAVCQL